MGHTSALITVVLALGNAPDASAFSTVLVPTLQEYGPQDFCLGDVTVPVTVGGSNTTISPGTNGTIQVLTNGDGAGEAGLYNCADVTFVSQPLSREVYDGNCVNSTGVRTSVVSGSEVGRSANGTVIGGGGAGTSSGSASGGAAGESSSQGAADRLVPMAGVEGVKGVGLVVLLAAVVGFALV